MRRGLLLLGALAAGCGGREPPVGPVAGELTISYAGPGPADGAILLLVNGPITAVRAAAPGYTVASASVTATSTRVVVTGDLVAGDLLKISVADVDLLSSYSAQVEGVADRTSFALGDPFLYTTQVRR